MSALPVTLIPGKPAVVANDHPIKNASSERPNEYWRPLGEIARQIVDKIERERGTK
jgi:hypothetical protein